MARILICHVPHDAAAARELGAALMGRGHTISFDGEPDSAREDRFPRLRHFDTVAIVWSEVAAASTGLSDMARDALSHNLLVPVVTDDLDARRLPIIFRKLNLFRARDVDGISRCVARLAAAVTIRKEIKASPPAPEPKRSLVPPPKARPDPVSAGVPVRETPVARTSPRGFAESLPLVPQRAATAGPHSLAAAQERSALARQAMPATAPVELLSPATAADHEVATDIRAPVPKVRRVVRIGDLLPDVGEEPELADAERVLEATENAVRLEKIADDKFVQAARPRASARTHADIARAEARAPERSIEPLPERPKRRPTKPNAGVAEKTVAEPSGARPDPALSPFEVLLAEGAAQPSKPEPELSAFERFIAESAPQRPAPRPITPAHVLEDVLALKVEQLLHFIPEQMYLGEPETAVVRLGSDALLDLVSEDAGVTGELPVVQTLSLSLHSYARVFEIARRAETTQYVAGGGLTGAPLDPNGTGYWEWHVTPWDYGEHALFVRISAVLRDSRGVPYTAALQDQKFPVFVSGRKREIPGWSRLKGAFNVLRGRSR
jgi:hypothetical protein